jgi:hypothetical protein
VIEGDRAISRVNKSKQLCTSLALWKDWVFAWWASAHQNKSQPHWFMGSHKLVPSSLAHPNLFWRLTNKWMHLVVWVCHGGFHDILHKEYSGTFYEVPWGLFKEMITNTHGRSDIVTYQTNIWNKVSTMPKGLFTTVPIRFISFCQNLVHFCRIIQNSKDTSKWYQIFRAIRLKG